MSANSEVSTTTWIKYDGPEYLIGMFVCIKTQMEMPVFRKITNIIRNDEAFFWTGSVDTLYFDDHFNAYCVEDRPDSFSVFSVKELLHYRPYDSFPIRWMKKNTLCHIF